MCERCKTLLSEGLDLCVRARKMDAQDRTNAVLTFSSNPDEWVASGRFEKQVARNNIESPHAPMMPRSGTVHLWMQDQYEKDLAEWESKSCTHLMQGCS